MESAFSGTPRRVIIDTDPGIDDAMALALALRSPELRVEAITTVGGNVNVELGTRNALRVLEALGVDNPPPVARGAGRPLERDPVDASHVHGADGLGDISGLAHPDGSPRYPEPRGAAIRTEAAALILDIVKKNPGEITLIAVGPLTNVALAIERDAGTMSQLAELIVMGGSVSGVGNVTPTAEFNFYADPHAAQRVLRAGLKTTVVGLDVTHQTLLAKSDLEAQRKKSSNPAGRFVADISELYFSGALKRRGRAACALHDPLAVGVAIDRSFVTTQSFQADIETEGPLTQGMLVADRRTYDAPSELQGRIEACMEVESDRFVEFFLSRVLPAT
jgi:purine nucleosidase/pyrimidine-specific ribonucleoside hydrolase